MIERAEIAALYEQYGPALYRRAFGLLGHEDDAHEVVQETFFQFWRGRSRFRRESSPFTFLYRITTNLSIDKLRRRKTAGLSFSLDEGLHSGALEGATEKRLEAASELAQLLDGLEEEHVMVAVMSFVDGMTQEEIGESVGVSRRTIVKRLKKIKLHVSERRARLVGQEGADE